MEIIGKMELLDEACVPFRQFRELHPHAGLEVGALELKGEPRNRIREAVAKAAVEIVGHRAIEANGARPVFELRRERIGVRSRFRGSAG